LVLPHLEDLEDGFEFRRDCRCDLFSLVKASTSFEEPVDRFREDYGSKSACNSDKGRLVLPAEAIKNEASIAVSSINRHGNRAKAKPARCCVSAIRRRNVPALIRQWPHAPGRPHGRFDSTTRPLTLVGEPEPAATGDEIRSLKCGGFDPNEHDHVACFDMVAAFFKRQSEV
jgi:hypothetical protein